MALLIRDMEQCAKEIRDETSPPIIDQKSLILAATLITRSSDSAILNNAHILLEVVKRMGSIVRKDTLMRNQPLYQQYSKTQYELAAEEGLRSLQKVFTFPDSTSSGPQAGDKRKRGGPWERSGLAHPAINPAKHRAVEDGNPSNSQVTVRRASEEEEVMDKHDITQMASSTGVTDSNPEILSETIATSSRDLQTAPDPRIDLTTLLRQPSRVEELARGMDSIYLTVRNLGHQSAEVAVGDIQVPVDNKSSPEHFWRVALAHRSLASQYVQWEQEQSNDSYVDALLKYPMGSNDHVDTYLRANYWATDDRTRQAIHRGLGFLSLEAIFHSRGITGFLAHIPWDTARLSQEEVLEFWEMLTGACQWGSVLQLTMKLDMWVQNCQDCFDTQREMRDNPPQFQEGYAASSRGGYPFVGMQSLVHAENIMQDVGFAERRCFVPYGQGIVDPWVSPPGITGQLRTEGEGLNNSSPSQVATNEGHWAGDEFDDFLAQYENRIMGARSSNHFQE